METKAHSGRRNHQLGRFRDGLGIGERTYHDPGEWFADKFTWTAPLKFNILFSITRD